MGEAFCYFLTESELVKVNEYLLTQGVNKTTDLNWMELHEINTMRWEQMYQYKVDVLSSEMGKTYGIEFNCKDLNTTSWSFASDLLKEVCTNYRLVVIKVSYSIDESPSKPKLYQYDTLMIPSALLEFLQHKKIIN